MRVSLIAILAASLLALPACKKKDEAKKQPVAAEPKPAEPKPAEPKPAEPKPVEPTPAADEMLNDMKNCPNAVAGATTKVEGTKGAVNLSITGKDEAATTEIRARAHKLLDAARPAGAEVKHTGEGTGGGGLGKCPAMLPDATAKVADVDGGVTITFTAADPAKLPELQKMAEERVAAMPAAAPGPDGEPQAEGAGDKK